MPGKLVDIFEEGDDTTLKSLALIAAGLGKRKNRDTEIIRLSDLTHDEIPLPWFPMQYLFQNRGMRQKSILEIIGPAHCGKTTLALQFASAAMLSCKASVLYLNADNKDMSVDRIFRIMNTEPGWRPSAALREAVKRTLRDPLGNILAQEGVDKCGCGCKYWEHDKCIDCADLWTRQGEDS